MCRVLTDNVLPFRKAATSLKFEIQSQILYADDAVILSRTTMTIGGTHIASSLCMIDVATGKTAVL
ncbi:MAG TPA: hypothetical protein VHQ92_10295 [Pseudolabrys sp.]|jgi:hypothetical protein|nr:hypothetical protein [Pseudolabrys sp.]